MSAMVYVFFWAARLEPKALVRKLFCASVEGRGSRRSMRRDSSASWDESSSTCAAPHHLGAAGSDAKSDLTTHQSAQPLLSFVHLNAMKSCRSGIQLQCQT